MQVVILIGLLSFYSISSSQSAATSFRTFEGSECFPSKENSTVLLCRSIPDCSKASTIAKYRKYQTVVFELENRNAIRSRAFYNCSFDFSLTFNFKNIQRIASYAFDSISVAHDHTLNFKFDGAILNWDKKNSQSRVLVNTRAFNNIVLSRKSRLNVYVKNYERAYVRDTLVENMMWQNENSEIIFNVDNVESVWFKSKQQAAGQENAQDKVQLLGDVVLDNVSLRESTGYELEISDAKPVNLPKERQDHYTANNLSYSLLVNNVNNLVFDPYVYANLQVNPYSDFNVFIRAAKNVFFNTSLFDSLMLGFYSRYILTI